MKMTIYALLILAVTTAISGCAGNPHKLKPSPCACNKQELENRANG